MGKVHMGKRPFFIFRTGDFLFPHIFWFFDHTKVFFYKKGHSCSQKTNTWANETIFALFFHPHLCKKYWRSSVTVQFPPPHFAGKKIPLFIAQVPAKTCLEKYWVGGGRKRYPLLLISLPRKGCALQGRKHFWEYVGKHGEWLSKCLTIFRHSWEKRRNSGKK